MADDKGPAGLFILDSGEGAEAVESATISFSSAIMNHPLRAVVPTDTVATSNDISLLKSLAESNAGAPSFNYGFDETTWAAYSTMHLCAACSLHNFRGAFNQWMSRQKKPPLDIEGCFLALNETVGNIHDPSRERGYRSYRPGDGRRGGDSRDGRRGYRHYENDPRARLKK